MYIHICVFVLAAAVSGQRAAAGRSSSNEISIYSMKTLLALSETRFNDIEIDHEIMK